MPLLRLADYMAPVPLKRKCDTSNEPKTDPMKRAYMLVPDEAKLWFVEIHAYQARVHGRSLACNIRRAKDLVPELFGPRTSLMPSQPCFVSASPLGSTSTAVCCASSASNSSPADMGHRLSMKRRPIECALMDQSFRASTTQDAFLDMIDAIDADMNARPGDAEQRNCTAYTQPLDQAYMQAFKNSIRSEVAKHFAENADSPQHRTAGWRFIDWKEVEQRELLARCRRRSQRQRARGARDGATGRRSQQRQWRHTHWYRGISGISSASSCRCSKESSHESA